MTMESQSRVGIPSKVPTTTDETSPTAQELKEGRQEDIGTSPIEPTIEPQGQAETHPDAVARVKMLTKFLESSS